MMRKRCIVLMCCSIFNVVGSELTSNKENVHYSNGFNFYHKPTSDGKLAVIYNCSQHIQEVSKTANWRNYELPKEMESLTIQNCNLNLTVDWDYDVRKIQEMDDHLFIYRFQFFEKLVFRNIACLTVAPQIAGFQTFMEGNITISIKDVQLMRVLQSDFLTSTVIKEKSQPNDVSSLHFVMKNVNIEKIESNAFFWEEGEIPLTLELHNVNVKQIASEAIKLQDYSNKNPFGNISSYPKNHIFITNSTFDTVQNNFIKGLAEDFHFTNNKVKVTENTTIGITAKNIVIANNGFNNEKDFPLRCTSRDTKVDKLEFDHRKGWIVNRITTSDCKVNVTYNCIDNGENNKTSQSWLLGDLPANTQSLTIQKCKLNLVIGGDGRSNEEKIKEMTKTKYEHFRELAFKHIKDLTIGPLLSGLQLIMNGNVSVSIEDVDNMRIVPSALITSDPKAYKYNNTNVGRLNFTMCNVNVDEMESEAIDWRKGDVPIELTWKNVNVKRIKTGAIKMHDYRVQYPLGKISSYPENNVYITNCTFNKLRTNVVTGLTKEFTFVNNRVDDIEPSAINITAKNITLYKNEFNHVHEFAFSSLSKGTNASLTFNSNVINSSDENSIFFGAYDLENPNDNTISIHENKFKCINSSWIFEKKNESTNTNVVSDQDVNSSVVSIYEKILFRNSDNICIDDEFKQSFVPVEQFYHQHPAHGNSYGKQPQKPASPINVYTFSLVIFVTLVIIAFMGFCLHRRGSLLDYLK